MEISRKILNIESIIIWLFAKCLVLQSAIPHIMYNPEYVLIYRVWYIRDFDGPKLYSNLNPQYSTITGRISHTYLLLEVVFITSFI